MNVKMSEKKYLVEISKVGWSIVWTIGLLIMVELALQVRSHIRYGSSVFNIISKQTSYELNPKYQLKLLRPNSIIQGSQAVIKSNSIGLRSPELPVKKQVGELRIAILGASTIMGAYTPDNKATLSYRLENYLQELFPKNKVHVINAGIAGYTLGDQQKMLDRVLAPFGLDLLIWYPGFNDISGYCQSETQKVSYGLPEIRLPKWLLSIELITKNTVWLRSTQIKKRVKDNGGTLIPIDLINYRRQLSTIFDSANNINVPVVTVTMARSFRLDMPIDEQLRLSETARYYNHCFDLEDLHKVYDQHNEELANVSHIYKNPVLRLDHIMPGGNEYFGDATHFSTKGTNFVAHLLSKEIVSLKVIPNKYEEGDGK